MRYAGYTGKIQVVNKEMIIDCKAVSYYKNKVVPCNFSEFEATR